MTSSAEDRAGAAAGREIRTEPQTCGPVEHAQSGSPKIFYKKSGKHRNRKGSVDKVCHECGVLLRHVPNDLVAGNWTGSDFRSRYYRCRRCTTAARKKGPCSRASRDRRDTAYYRVRYALRRARIRARKAGISDTARAKDLLPLPSKCPLLGVELYYGSDVGYRPDRASIDRTDSTKGYEPGNIWIISYRANNIKSDATLAELKAVVAGLRRKLSATGG
jgi:hypothetical protein